jgi:hypothetical protein
VRWWNELVAAVADITPGGVPVLALILFGLAAITALALYYWPRWLPWRWARRRGRSGSRWGRFRLRRPRFAWPRLGSLRWRWRLRWRRRSRAADEPADDLPADELGDLPADVLALTADQLAAAGRFAEAVRERLRAIVRDLIERGVLPYTPGWTVMELAAAAAAARPSLAPPLRAAAELFSEIWYGQRPADASDDAAMREHAQRTQAVLAMPVGAP